MEANEMQQLLEQMDTARDIMTQTMKTLSTDLEYFKIAARCYKRLFDALIDEGFEREEALFILKNYNPMMR